MLSRFRPARLAGLTLIVLAATGIFATTAFAATVYGGPNPWGGLVTDYRAGPGEAGMSLTIDDVPASWGLTGKHILFQNPTANLVATGTGACGNFFGPHAVICAAPTPPGLNDPGITVWGTNNNDTVVNRTAGANMAAHGLGGNDTLKAGPRGGWLYGDTGGDQLVGGIGGDSLYLKDGGPDSRADCGGGSDSLEMDFRIDPDSVGCENVTY